MFAFSLLCRPGPAAPWELWRCPKRGEAKLLERFDEPGADSAHKDPVVLGVPSTHCRTLSFRVPTRDAALLGPTVATMLEKRGLVRVGKGGEIFRFAAAGPAGENDTLVVADVIDGGTEAAFRRPGKFTSLMAAPRMLPLPENGLVLHREGDRWLLLVSRDGQLAYSQIVGAGATLPRNLGDELPLALMALRSEGIVAEDMKTLHVWHELTGWERNRLERQTGLIVTPSPAPVPTGEALTKQLGVWGVAPQGAVEARNRRRRGLLAVGVAAALLAANAALIQKFRGDVRRKQAELAAMKSPAKPDGSSAEGARAASERWKAMLPVVDFRRYPLAHFVHVTREMPGGGIVIDQFEWKTPQLKLTGRASSAKTAYDFLANLQKSAGLKVYRWSMPQPKVDADNTARFEIQGVVSS